MPVRGDTLTFFHVENSERDMCKPMSTPRASSGTAVVGTSNILSFYTGMANKLMNTRPGVAAGFVMRNLADSIKAVICKYIEDDAVLADLLVLGSAELVNPDTPGTFGSVAAATAKKASCSVMVVKEAMSLNAC